MIVKIKTPQGCAFFPTEPRCGIAPVGPLALDTANVTITSSTEGTRTLPLRVETADGETFVASIAGGFSALADEDVDVTIERIAGVPDLTIDVRAEWTANADPGAAASDALQFLGTIEGATFAEIGTSAAGYRAYRIEFPQLLDPSNLEGPTFMQTMVLHHKDKAAPTILYTSGYSLFSQDDLSELALGLGANQISTEQRFFGTSLPANAQPADWLTYVDIAKAAADHHEVVSTFEPFYAGAWLSTGHSKGGMTSIFHRRFYPDDVDATVAYVAPISYAFPDRRYDAFLDRIGDEACRTAIRTVQRNALMKLDELVAIAAQNPWSETYVRAGGAASAYEKGILSLEWGYWQHYTAADCAAFLQAPTDAQGLYDLLVQVIGHGWSDASNSGFETYYHQAETQLGIQSHATAHLAGLLEYEQLPYDYSLPGLDPVHDPAPMQDIQQWVHAEGDKLLFVYGERDPWTGGAYDITPRDGVVKLTAPGANHGALLRDLTEADRRVALDKIEGWVGKRPTLTPGVQPLPMMPRLR